MICRYVCGMVLVVIVTVILVMVGILMIVVAMVIMIMVVMQCDRLLSGILVQHN